MWLKFALNSLIFTLIGALMLGQLNVINVLAVAGDIPLTSPVTSPVETSEPSTSPSPTPSPSPEPITNPISLPSPTPAPITSPITEPEPTHTPSATPSPTPTPEPSPTPSPATVVAVDPSNPQVVINSTSPALNISVASSVINPNLSLTDLLITSQTAASAILNNSITIDTASSLGHINVQMPAGIMISGPASWAGLINMPLVQPSSSVIPTTEAGTIATTTAVIEIGAGDTFLTLDKAVRILIPGQAGKLVGYSLGTVFTKISQNCSADTQAVGDALAGGTDCFISVGNDLVVWTKHFTKFVTYTQKATNSGSNSNSNSNSNPGAPVCTDTKPQSQPKLLSATVSGRNQVTLNWSKALDPVTYYLVAYGTKPNTMQYGNPNVGGKDTTSYVVKGLTNGTTYYFKLRAGNNCMPGEFSNEIAVKASGDNYISGPAIGFKYGVLSTQKQATPTAQAKFKPVTSYEPSRWEAVINFFLHLFLEVKNATLKKWLPI